jgi:6-phosphogluconolactonase
MQIHKFKSSEETIHALATAFVERTRDSIRDHEECTVVLSGGSSPKRLYELLAGPDFAGKIDWSKLYFFFGDERYVPSDSEEYNGRMVKQSLFEPLGIHPDQIYYFETSLNPEDCAKDYAKKIRTHFGGRPIRFNILLLGLGDDAHTASLFPNTSILNEEKAWVSAVKVEKLNGWRISLTATLINEAEWIAFLVYGPSKREALKAVLEGERNSDLYPAQLIQPETGELNWFVDEEAAGLIKDI